MDVGALIVLHVVSWWCDRGARCCKCANSKLARLTHTAGPEHTNLSSTLSFLIG